MRNGYIDVIKFIFAIIIAEFHLNSGLFLGGRIAVDGFFMISSYLMMKYIERDKHPEEGLGVSTIRFISHKYKGLFPVLLPSVILAFTVYSFLNNRTIETILTLLPKLLFELIPLRNAGYEGQYVLGISWYISSMFIALAILYPLCRKFRSNFILTVCPLTSILLYGILCNQYGHLAVGSDFLENTLLNTGIMRALAACSLGLLIYEISERLPNPRPNSIYLFTFLEIAGFAYLLYSMKFHAKSSYEYILVYILFGLLIIGINKLSYTSRLFNGRWTKWLGTLSTLIVMNHYCWNRYLLATLGANYAKTHQAWIYVAVVAGACVIVYLASILLRKLMKKISESGLYSSKIE